MDSSKPIDPRKAVFVGGVPRPLKAAELAEVMTVKYGNVALIMIDSDSDLKYPKGKKSLAKIIIIKSCSCFIGAACVVFSSHASYIAAVSARFMQLNYGSLDKKACKICCISMTPACACGNYFSQRWLIHLFPSSF